MTPHPDPLPSDGRGGRIGGAPIVTRGGACAPRKGRGRRGMARRPAVLTRCAHLQVTKKIAQNVLNALDHSSYS